MHHAKTLARCVVTLAALALPSSAAAQLAIGSGPGHGPVVRVLSATNDRTVLAYPPAFPGGVSVALGDVNGDGTADVITGAGPGGVPQVRILSGTDLRELHSFFAYAPGFAGGVSVAAGDIDGDGRTDVITGAGPNGDSRVRVFSGRDLHELASFSAYDLSFRGGVHVAAGDITGDGRTDIITGAGEGGAPRVAVFSGVDLGSVLSFDAYDPGFAGGASVAAGDINGDGRTDIVTGAGPGGAPQVRVFSGIDLRELAGFVAYDPEFRGGVHVAAGDIDGDGRTDLVTGTGPGGPPHVRIFSGADGRELASFVAFGSGTSGVSVGSIGDVAGPGLPGTALRFTSAPATTFAVGSAGAFIVTTRGSATTVLSSTGALPAGVTFVDRGDGTGALSGTPAAGTAGTYDLTFTASDGVDSPAVQPFTLIVRGASVFLTGNAASFTAGSAAAFTVTASGAPPPALATAGALPAGVTFIDHGNGTATLGGTPRAGTAGTYALTFTAANGIDAAAVQSFTLTVRAPIVVAHLAMGSGPGSSSAARALSATGDRTVRPYTAGFLGGVSVALGDVNGDGTPDLITGAGPGGSPQVRVFSGRDLQQLHSFLAYDAGFSGGVQVAAGDIDGDRRADIITGAGPGGGSHVRVFSGTDLHELVGFFAYGAAAPGAVSVSAGDIDGDGRIDLITGAGQGGGPRVKVFNSAGSGLLASFDAYGPGFTGGVRVAAGDIDGDGRTDIVTGAGPGGGPQVRVFSGVDLGLLESFDAYDPGFSGGVHVAAGDVDGDGRTDLITGSGQGGPPHVRVLSGAGLHELASFYAFDTGTGGVSVGSTGGIVGGVRFTSAAAATFSAGVAGTFTVTTAGTPAPTVNVTGTLPAGVLFSDPGAGTATLSGVPEAGTGGAYALTFTANNGVGGDVVQSFTLNIQEAPLITSANSATFLVGAAASFTVTTTGLPAPNVSRVGTLPSGITFTPGTRVLGGTATQVGTFDAIQFTAANGISPDAVQSFTLSVVCPTVTVGAATPPDGRYQVPYGPFTFTQAGSTGSSFTWEATGLPAGLTIGATTGAVSGTPAGTVLNGVVAITVTDNFGCRSTRNTAITVRPTADDEVYGGGVGGTQYVVAASGPSTPHVLVIDNVKAGDNGPGILSVTFSATSANGTIAEGGTDGTFIYTPNLNFAGPSDGFTYTLTDGNGVTTTGTVTISLSGMVWYVNSLGGNGDGRSHNPFNTLASAATASSSNQVVYVHTGGPTTPGAITLDPGQLLQGQGGTFTLNGLALPAGTRPTLTGTVNLASNTVVRDLNSTGGIRGLSGDITLPVTIDQVNVTGGSFGLALTNTTASATGAINVSNASFTNQTGSEVQIVGGNIPITFASTATITSNVGRSIDIQDRTGGSIVFNGSITDTAQGIFLDDNVNTTFAFTGGLNLNGSSSTFRATDGGTLTITGTNTIGATTAATSTALQLSNTAIGPAGVVFRSISSSGGLKGIVLNVTGAGPFTVSGTGPAGSGGTIRNALIRGAEFISANSVALNHMIFDNNGIGGSAGNCGDAIGASAPGNGGFVTSASCASNIHLESLATAVLNTVTATNSDGHGISGYQVGGLTLTDVDVERNGTSAGEDGVQLVNSGTVTVNGASRFRDNASNQFEARNGIGSAAFNITGAFFGLTNFPTAGGIGEAPSPGMATANSGLVISGNGTATMTVTVEGSTFDENFVNGYVSDTGDSATMSITLGTALSGNTFTNNGAPIGIVNGSAGGLTYVVRNNTITNDTAITGTFATTAIAGARSGAGSVMTGTIDDNVIGSSLAAATSSGCFVSACDGISLTDASTSGANSYQVTVTNNQINHVQGGITSRIGGVAGGAPRTSLVITGNTIRNPDAPSGPNGILIDSGTLATNPPQTCVEISGNTLSGHWGAGSNDDSIRYVHRGASGATFRVRNYDGVSDVDAFVRGINTFGAGTVDGFGFELVGSNAFTGGAAACN